MNNEELNKGDGGNKEGVRGFLVDASFLWEMYLYNLLNRRLDDWEIDAQCAFRFYEDTFYPKENRPDLVLTNRNTGDIFIFDAKFKRMRFKGDDVDNEDLQQLHSYSYRFHLKYKDKFKGAGFIYPTKMDLSEGKQAESSMFGLETDKKFGVFTIKDPGENGNIEESENAFIAQIKKFLEEV